MSFNLAYLLNFLLILLTGGTTEDSGNGDSSGGSNVGSPVGPMAAGAVSGGTLGFLFATKVIGLAAAAGPVGWIVGAGILIGAGLGYLFWSHRKSEAEKAQEAYEEAKADIVDNANENLENAEIPSDAELDEIAQNAGGYGGTGGGGGVSDNSGRTLTPDETPMTTAEAQDAAEQANGQDAEDAREKYEEAVKEQDKKEEEIKKEQENNVIDNPFDGKSNTANEDEEKSEETTKEYSNAKKKLKFDSSDFDGLDGYTYIINNIPVKMYVKSEIKLVSEDEDFTKVTTSEIESEKYTDAKGQTHAVSKAYDQDGNQLDKTILSEQTGYLEYGKDSMYGFAKFTGEGNKTAYTIEGYGDNQFVASADNEEVYFNGTFELEDDEEDKEVKLGENSKIAAKKEYKFRDEVALEISSTSAKPIADGYKAAIIWGANIMREVNIQSFTLDFGDAEIVLGSSKDNDKEEDIQTFEEDGKKYTYDANSTVTNKTTGATYTTKDVLENDMKTMKELIDEGFKPETVDGEKYKSTKKDDSKKDDSSSKKSDKSEKTTEKEEEETTEKKSTEDFKIVITPATDVENYEKEIIYEGDDRTYYFTTKRSSRYSIVTDTKTYTLKEAINEFGIDALIDEGLDCKSYPTK